MALVRIKRRAQDDPIDVLLLTCKKFKADDETPVTKVFKFAATVNEEVGDIKSHLSRAAGESKTPLKYRQNEVTSITDKLRAENKLFSENNRLKVVNCFRAIDSNVEVENPRECVDGKPLTIVDIESKPSSTHEEPKDSNSSELPSLTEEQYVYDLYYSRVGDFDDLQMENLLSAHEVNERLIFADYLDNESNKDGSDCDDDDDSNDENNWRNDYPDEDDDSELYSSMDEEDRKIAMAIGEMKIHGDLDSDLSSDREDEHLIYCIDERLGYHQALSDESLSDFYD